MKVLIVGSSGYLGSNLAKYLPENGYKVIAGSRSASSFSSSNVNVQHVAIDLNDATSYRGLLSEIDSIIYLAGPGGPLRDQFANNLIQEHLVNLATFLEENTKCCNRPIIFSSSGGTIYGRGNGIPLRENDPLEPINPYGLLKLLSEKLLKYYHKNKGTQYISMRISNPYGGIAHKKLDQGVINIFIRKILANEPIEIWGDGSSIRDYIFMPDLMVAFNAALNATEFTGSINIGGGCGSSLAKICKLIEINTGNVFRKNYQPKNPYLIDYSVLDITVARDVLGWEPKHSVEDGIIQMVNH